VLSQCTPDPDFSATENPNPEMPEAYKAAIRLMRESGAELAIATDPDCDRLGAVIHCGDREQLLTGNQSGAIILYYILSRMKERGTLPENGVMFNTVVTSTLGDRIAESFGLSVEKTLTGFKFIGDKIKTHEKLGDKTFVFGYEESYGCLIRDFVRDKDAVQASLLTCEMACAYRLKGMTLLDALEDIYKEYGCYREEVRSFSFAGREGMETMANLMANLRANPPKEVAGNKVEAVVDYKSGIATAADGTQTTIDFPKANMIEVLLSGKERFIMRPSGTEPKVKLYFGVRGEDQEKAKARIDELIADCVAYCGL